MQAIVNHRAGDPRQLYIVERPTPVILPNQVLIHVKAASVNIADTQEFQDYYQKKHVPTKTKLLDRAYVHSENKVLGADGAGIIVAVGSKIKDFQLGDEVIFIADDYLHGAWAEYIAVSRKNIVLKPQNLSFTAAAALPTTAGTALAALKKAQLKVGQKVLINGASGGVGLFALQIAKAYGASVSAVVSSYNFDLVKKFGAKEVYDYHTTDITRKARTKFNVIIGVNGYHSVQDYKKILSFDGRYVAVGGVKQAISAGVLGPLATLGRKKQISMTSLFALKGNWLEDLAVMASNKGLVPYLDAVFPAAEIQAAVKYATTQHLKGKVVLQISE